MGRRDFGLVIGISRYASLRSLQGPSLDAHAFKTWLLGSGDVPSSQIKLVVNDPPVPDNRPIQHDIDKAFGELIEVARRLPADYPARRLYFYFAGHGCASTVDHLALIMANASMDELNYSLNAKSYQDRLAHRAVFKEQIFFYDCCRQFDSRVPGRDPPWTVDRPRAGAGRVRELVLFGAVFTEYANERKLRYSERRGLFTKVLLEGLNGGAAGDDGEISVKNLFPFVKRRLEAVARSEGLSQEADKHTRGDVDDLILASGITPTRVRVTVVTGLQDADIVVDDGEVGANFREVRRGRSRGRRVEFDLVPGLYRIRTEDGRLESALEVRPGEPTTVDLGG